MASPRFSKESTPRPAIDPAIAALRVPPHSIEAEQSVLGGLLLDNNAWDKIGDVVSESDFYRDEHRRIFRAIQKLMERSKPADVITVSEALENAGDKDSTGGLAYVSELASNVPGASNIRRYAEIVRERAVLRQLVTAGDEISESALNPMGRDTTTLLDEAEQKV
ncbi:MAG TPA: DnaB-like helicase N-terminal domain-containing protein, partial [Rhodocyclaceae bacterium]|nr:DnaB-like helicase N-terminal domain-containing protein [Rhodocyclaceae bacterium]